MAKNRKHQSAAIRFGPALKAFLLCLLICGSALGYVWQKSQIDQLGLQIKKREVHLKELRDQNEKLRRALAYMKSPPFLEERVQTLHLGLVPTQPTQVWYLKEPVPEANKQNRELASRQMSSVTMNE